MAEQSRVCWGCGKEPSDGIKFQRCVHCAERKLPSSYFCGEECMLANWPRHKKWHKQQKELACHSVPDRDHLAAEIKARDAKETGSEYDKLLAHAMSLGNQGDLQGSARAFRRLIKMKPTDPEPHSHLGMVLFRSHNMPEASQLYLKAMELDHKGRSWAMTAASAMAVLMMDACCDVPKPEWWSDEGLKALSAEVVAILPDDDYESVNACLVRAQVLAGVVVGASDTPWPRLEMRTSKELEEAGFWFRRYGALKKLWARDDGDLAVKVTADACDEMAAKLAQAEARCSAAHPDRAARPDEIVAALTAAEAEAKEAPKAAEAKAAASRAAAVTAEAEVKAAREEAEAKATAAAEELLADEEKEKVQAEARNTAGKSKGKAKGKGKKGQGKR